MILSETEAEIIIPSFMEAAEISKELFYIKGKELKTQPFFTFGRKQLNEVQFTGQSITLKLIKYSLLLGINKAISNTNRQHYRVF